MFVIFLTGVSGQFMSEMYGDASYGTVVIFMLLELWLLLNYIKSDYNKKKYLILFTILLAFLTTCSFRFPIYVAAPIICILIYFCYSDGFKKKYLKILGLIIVAVIVNGALVLSGLKTAGGSIYEFAKDRLDKSKDSLNQIKDSIRDNTETNAVGDLYIVFPKGYTATTEVYEENATFTNNVLSCNVITKYVDSVDYNYSPTDYLNNKINNSFLEYKNIKIKNYDWIMVKSPDSSPRFVTYVATYEGKIYDVTFETNSENPELCFVSSDAAALPFLFQQKRDY
jgi:hypothetical protein